MAARQMSINNMAPKERQEQEKWSQEQISLGGCCIANFEWLRAKNGYQCSGTNHFINDQLLAMGNGWFYQTGQGNFELQFNRGPSEPHKELWAGPFDALSWPFDEPLIHESGTVPYGLDIPGDKLGIEPKSLDYAALGRMLGMPSGTVPGHGQLGGRNNGLRFGFPPGAGRYGGLGGGTWRLWAPRRSRKSEAILGFQACEYVRK
jgi:hypothetical protein